MPRLHDQLKVTSFILLLLCFLLFAQGLQSVQAESIPSYIKYPDLWDSSPGMQPIIDEERTPLPPARNKEAQIPERIEAPKQSQKPQIPSSPPPKPSVKPQLPTINNEFAVIEEPESIVEHNAPMVEQVTNPTVDALNMDEPFVVLFREGSSDLAPLERDKIINEFLEDVFQDKQRTVRILSYSDKVQGHSAGAKRMALSRGLMLREFLIANGLNAARIDLHVLGFVEGDARPNRAELFIQ